MTNRFQTAEGENANDWKTRSFYNMIRGERWVLHQASEDPRGRIWHKLDKNGKVVDVKKGALNLGGNIAEWTKGGMGNLFGDEGDYQKNSLKVGSTKKDKSTKKGNRGFLGWRSFADTAFRDATDLDNMGPSGGFGTSGLLGTVANQIDPSKSSKSSRKSNLRIEGTPGSSRGAQAAQAMAKERIKAGKSPLGDFGTGEDRGMLAAQWAAKNKKKLKFTKEQKKWIKENPSGTFINEYGVDEAYSPEFDLIRFNQAKKHKQWLIDHGRV